MKDHLLTSPQSWLQPSMGHLQGRGLKPFRTNWNPWWKEKRWEVFRWSSVARAFSGEHWWWLRTKISSDAESREQGRASKVARAQLALLWSQFDSVLFSRKIIRARVSQVARSWSQLFKSVSRARSSQSREFTSRASHKSREFSVARVTERPINFGCYYFCLDIISVCYLCFLDLIRFP